MPSQLRAEGCAPGSRALTPDGRSRHRLPEGALGRLRGARRQSACCGLCLRSSEWRRGVCMSSWKRRANGIPLPPSPFSPKTARAVTISRGGKGGNNSRVERTSAKQKGGAKPSLCLPSTFPGSGMWHRPQKSRSDRVRPEPPSSLPSRVTECVLRGGGKLVNFNICAALLFGLWRGTGISAMFLLLTTLSARGEPGWGVGWWRTAVEC